MIWDALVIGAGPAGSVAARELARRGFRVLMVDKASFPRSKVCGCCLNSAAVRTLRRLGLEATLRDGVPLQQVRLAAPGATATIPLPGGLALSRERFDSRLVEEAKQAGAEFRPNTAMPPRADAAHNTVAFPTRLTLTATGLLGSDSQPQPGSRIGAGTMVPACEAPAFYQRGTIYMATGRGGYVGLVRVEDDRLDIAAALDAELMRSHGGLGPAIRTIIANCRWPIPDCWDDLIWKGTPGLTRQAKRVWEHRTFRVGDAAGYVEPFTGEGMAWAIRTAAAVAPIAAQAIANWDDRLGQHWAKTLRRVIGQRQRTCRLIAWALRSPLLTGLAIRILKAAPLLSWPMLRAINRPTPPAIE
jgi:flavin-dependent dehydrogenase